MRITRRTANTSPTIRDRRWYYFDAEGRSESDWNVYAQGGVFYSYDFGNQRGDALEASVTTYNTRQFDLEEFNFNQAEATLGVRFGVPTGHPTALASIKPYLTSSGALLDDEALYWEGGGGVQGTLPVGNWTFGAYAQAVWREYDENTAERASRRIQRRNGMGLFSGPAHRQRSARGVALQSPYRL